MYHEFVHVRTRAPMYHEFAYVRTRAPMYHEFVHVLGLGLPCTMNLCMC